jgi:hypothetical protein
VERTSICRMGNECTIQSHGELKSTHTAMCYPTTPLSKPVWNRHCGMDWVGKSRCRCEHQNIVCTIHPCVELHTRAGAVQWHNFHHRVGTVACVLLVRAGADINLQNKVHVRPRCGEIQLCNDIKALSWTRKVDRFWKAYSHQYVLMVSAQNLPMTSFLLKKQAKDILISNSFLNFKDANMPSCRL